jgi:hypothetical protein
VLPTPVSPRPRLVLVEGVAGTGKTTTATTVHRLLADGGAPTRLLLEGDVAHPADHEQVAVLDRDGWSALLARHGSAAAAPALEPLLEAVPPGLLPPAPGLGRRDDAVLVPYGLLRREHPGLSDALLADVAGRDVYEQPVDVWRALTLHRWRRFVAAAVGSPTTWVLDCCFLQNPLTVLLARHDVPVDEATAHVLAVGELLRPLATCARRWAGSVPSARRSGGTTSSAITPSRRGGGVEVRAAWRGRSASSRSGPRSSTTSSRGCPSCGSASTRRGTRRRRTSASGSSSGTGWRAPLPCGPERSGARARAQGRSRTLTDSRASMRR